MITPLRVFFKRLFAELKFQVGIWRMVIDWTVALYIVIPAIALGINQYLSWWRNTPDWLEFLPVSLFFAVCFLLAWSGSVRIFLQEADQLFLLGQRQWIKKIMQYGLIYSYFRSFLFTGFFFLLLAPLILSHHQFSQRELFLLFTITFLVKVFLGLAKQFLSIRFCGWRLFIILWGMMVAGSMCFIILLPYIIGNFPVFLTVSLLLSIASVLLSIRRLNHIHSFFADVEREQGEKLKHVSFLLGLSGASVKKPKKQRKRPWLFPRSNIIFRKRNAINGLVEVCLKSILRDSRRVGQYLLFVFICGFVIIDVQDSGKLFVWLTLSFVLAGFVGLYWQECLGSEFIQLLCRQNEEEHLALRKFLFLMTLPGILVISFIPVFQAFSWIGVMMIIPVCTGLVYSISRIVAFFLVIMAKGCDA